ncbi:bacterio-opsin activator domain-containing protein [Haloarchaeobius amylolyticus]|uniref:helix-turn-helix domain-containing protein n=1 Tax=Haloarchaeobius amylolyticus TaxID=1198296 RepID=UPI00226E12AD|nr:bacterio-opsin activator domain-containing protein [Haloarchaeobius amylolyticus]
MSTIVEAVVPAEEFALAEAMRRVSDVHFEFVRFAAQRTDGILPYLWAEGAPGDTLPRTVASDETTTDVSVLAALEDGYLLDVDWHASARIVASVLLEEGATIVDAVARDGVWRFRLLFPGRDAVSRTYDRCEENDIDLEIRRLSELTDSFQRGLFGLTEEQYETISNAHDEGYYEIPRESDLTELANESEVSHQALSERLRRGHERLIANALFTES